MSRSQRKRKIAEVDRSDENKIVSKKQARSKAKISNLFTLPPEMIGEVLRYLNTQESTRFSFACKKCRNIIWPSLPRINLPPLPPNQFDRLVKQCANMTALESINLRVTQVKSLTSTDASNYFKSCNRVTKLEFDTASFDPFNLINNMTGLQSIAIHWNKRQDPNDWTLDLPKLFPNHPHLTSFSLIECSLSELRGLHVLTDLKCLTLEDCVNLADEDSLLEISTTITNLNELNLRFMELEDLKCLTNFQELTALSLADSSLEGNLSLLLDMTNLKSLDLQNFEVLKNSSVAAIAKLTQLTRLIILHDEHENIQADIKSLSVLTNIKELALDAFVELKNFKNLKKATFQYCYNLLDFGVLPNLVDLTIQDIQFTKQKESKKIMEWNQLTRLHFDYFNAQTVIPYLSYLTNLQELGFDSFYNNCQPRLFKALRPLTSLRTLTMQNLILSQAFELNSVTQLQLVKVLCGADYEFDGDQLTVAIQYNTNNKFLNTHNPFSSNYDDDSI